MMNRSLPFPAAALSALVILSIRVSTLAQAGAASPVSGIQPTVTVETGNLGEKLFGKRPELSKVRRHCIAAYIRRNFTLVDLPSLS